MDQVDETSTEVPTPEAGSLRRSADHRVIAGVAGGIGERFDIDANIVRVIFVVLTVLWGLGAAIYLAMWVLIPRSADGLVNTDNESLAPSTSRLPYVAMALGTIVLALVFVSTVGGEPQFGGGLVLLWLIFLVVVAIVSLWAPQRRLTLRRMVAMAFLVGLSFLIVLSGVLIGFLESTGVPITGGNGVRTWQSTSFAQVRPAYRTEFGLSTLNLSAVNFPSSGFSVVDTLSVGRLEIVLPANAIVELKTHVGIGTISIENGPGGSPVAQFQPVPSTLHSAQSQSQAPHVTIDAEVGIGHILIVRALAK